MDPRDKRGHKPLSSYILVASELVLAATLLISLFYALATREPNWMLICILGAIGLGLVEVFRFGAKRLASLGQDARRMEASDAQEAAASADAPLAAEEGHAVRQEGRVPGDAPAAGKARPAIPQMARPAIPEIPGTDSLTATEEPAGEPVAAAVDETPEAPEDVPEETPIPTSTLDFPALTKRLLEARDPLGIMQDFAREVQDRADAAQKAEGPAARANAVEAADAGRPDEADADARQGDAADLTDVTDTLAADPSAPEAALAIRNLFAGPEGGAPLGSGPLDGASSLTPVPTEPDQPLVRPSDLEVFAARMLSEAGIFATEVDLPPFKVVSLGRSGLFYLRANNQGQPMAYLARLRLLKLEAALNQIRFAADHLPADATLEDCYDVNQLVLHHICSQVGPIDTPYQLEDGDLPDTEWTVRRQIATMVESIVLPYRLELDFRVNVADNNVSIEFKATPEQVFPSSMHVSDLGVVASSREMRRKAASAYAQRLAVLLAGIAFRTSRKILHVWVAATVDTANHHWCYLSVDFDRWRFSQLDLERDLVDASRLDWVYRRFVPARRLENGMLRPVSQTFSLSEDRFCPPRRQETVSLSARRIPPRQAEVLGSNRVSGLSIEEGDKRVLVANDIMRRLVPNMEGRLATQDQVRTIMEVAGDDPDPTVRAAAERTIRNIIDGRVGDDAASIGRDFCEGDDLTQAALRAHQLLEAKDPQGAIRVLGQVLASVDNRGLYADSATVEWRYFSSYVDRVLYNRLYQAPEASVLLVPDSYFECHLMISAAYASLGQTQEALAHGRRVLELAPVDRRAHLHYVRCLEQRGLMREATDQLRRLLSIAHDPEGLGVGYYRMAYFQWQEGNVLSAEACYLSCLAITRGGFPLAAMELSALALQNPEAYREGMTQAEVVKALNDADIPVAPTEDMTKVFLSCMRASVDAEVFPVARSFVSTLAGLYPDDVVFDILRSLDTEPDR